jgi:CheY-like chemotaxis protein
MLQNPKPATPRKIARNEKDPFSQDLNQAAPSPPIAAAVGNGRRILVVDDSSVVLKAVEAWLKSDGFKVSTLSNPAAVATAAEHDQIELIVLDLHFPPCGGMEWNGFTVMQWLRRFPRLARIPVILVSGSEPALHKERALRAGAVALFEKPLNYKALLATILQALPSQSNEPRSSTSSKPLAGWKYVRPSHD